MKRKKTALFSEIKSSYGRKYQSHLFGQYKIYLSGMEKISDRRQQANNFFVSVNTALISLIGLALGAKIFDSAPWLGVLFSVLGIAINIAFYYLINSYKQINTGKFNVIHKIEEKLPLQLYMYEWKMLDSGKNRKKYLPFSHVELWIPRIFILLYIAIGLFFIYGKLRIYVSINWIL